MCSRVVIMKSRVVIMRSRGGHNAALGLFNKSSFGLRNNLNLRPCFKSSYFMVARKRQLQPFHSRSYILSKFKRFVSMLSFLCIDLWICHCWSNFSIVALRIQWQYLKKWFSYCYTRTTNRAPVPCHPLTAEARYLERRGVACRHFVSLFAAPCLDSLPGVLQSGVSCW